ncbi:MAG: sigma-70 family RNA polymerase sigma factor [Planctomycetia bacterium]|nr:MAG: sigma-70 family RNA polymerase sigma factor [Planctomycetia bacterium]
MSDDRQSLLERARRGDRDAISALLVEVGPQVRARLNGRIGAAWRGVLDEDDVMQVTYMEAFLRFFQFAPQGENALIAWLAQIAENNLRDAIRGLERAKRPDPRRRVQTSAQDSSYALLENLARHSGTPSKIMRREESVSMLDEAIAQLPADYQTVVREYDLEGNSADAVAKKMGRTEGAIYMLRARALERLRELLGSSFLRLA